MGTRRATRWRLLRRKAPDRCRAGGRRQRRRAPSGPWHLGSLRTNSGVWLDACPAPACRPERAPAGRRPTRSLSREERKRRWCIGGEACVTSAGWHRDRFAPHPERPRDDPRRPHTAPDRAERVLQENRSQISAVPGGGWAEVAMDTSRPPFDDVNVRKAVIAGMDREALRLQFGGETFGPIAQHYIPPGTPGLRRATAGAASATGMAPQPAWRRSPRRPLLPCRGPSERALRRR